MNTNVKTAQADIERIHETAFVKAKNGFADDMLANEEVFLNTTESILARAHEEAVRAGNGDTMAILASRLRNVQEKRKAVREAFNRLPMILADAAVALRVAVDALPPTWKTVHGRAVSRAIRERIDQIAKKEEAKDAEREAAFAREAGEAVELIAKKYGLTAGISARRVEDGKVVAEVGDDELRAAATRDTEPFEDVIERLFRQRR